MIIGQNKNEMVLFVMMLLVARAICKMFEHGRSYLPCDQDFSVIEKRKVVTKTYLPSDISKVIEEVRHDRPFKTIDIDKTDFRNVQVLSKKYFNTTNMQISKCVQIRVTRDTLQKGQVQTKNTHNAMEQWADMTVFKKGFTFDLLKKMDLPELASTHQICKEKLNDLRNMIKYLPIGARAYYEELCKVNHDD
ncbi:hypothetical protein PR048_033171 [Dryococelus australis]|uniref:Uncharacterized protein n=1 Tax=Dryococelus australis TaxID=614101 RepID=A0ABQ9G3Q5_9NEOP|nr:hypothetical protein PR048_033171 [Dryococelus australis]